MDTLTKNIPTPDPENPPPPYAVEGGRALGMRAARWRRPPTRAMVPTSLPGPVDDGIEVAPSCVGAGWGEAGLDGAGDVAAALGEGEDEGWVPRARCWVLVGSGIG
jgi:hypothetical protein